jgi:hypothetical protein
MRQLGERNPGDPNAASTRREVTVVSDALPVVGRFCPGCKRLGRFACSSRFRLNFNGKLGDVWLLYRCDSCDHAYGLEIVERTPVGRIDPELLYRATENDECLAAEYARDLPLLKRNGVRLLEGDRWRMSARRSSPPAVADPAGLTIRFPEPLIVRLDGVLASSLGLRRSEVVRLVRRGSLRGEERANLRTLRLWSTCRWIIGAA